jgi:hypothetical protein
MQRHENTADKEKGETPRTWANRRSCEGLAFSQRESNRTVRYSRSLDDSDARHSWRRVATPLPFSPYRVSGSASRSSVVVPAQENAMTSLRQCVDADVAVTYVRESGAPVSRTYSVVDEAARDRCSRSELGIGTLPLTDLSTLDAARFVLRRDLQRQLAENAADLRDPVPRCSPRAVSGREDAILDPPAHVRSGQRADRRQPHLVTAGREHRPSMSCPTSLVRRRAHVQQIVPIGADAAEDAEIICRRSGGDELASNEVPARVEMADVEGTRTRTASRSLARVFEDVSARLGSMAPRVKAKSVTPMLLLRTDRLPEGKGLATRSPCPPPRWSPRR